MASTGMLGTRLWVGSIALTNITSAADQLADYTALSAGVEVSFIESMGTFGKQFQEVDFQAVADGRTIKYKGGFNSGSFPITVAQDLSDPGQALLQQYGTALDQNTYPFKLLFIGMDPTVSAAFFGAKVMSYQTVLASVNNVIKATINLAINTDIFYGPDNGG